MCVNFTKSCTYRSRPFVKIHIKYHNEEKMWSQWLMVIWLLVPQGLVWILQICTPRTGMWGYSGHSLTKTVKLKTNIDQVRFLNCPQLSTWPPVSVWSADWTTAWVSRGIMFLLKLPVSVSDTHHSLDAYRLWYLTHIIYLTHITYLSHVTSHVWLYSMLLFNRLRTWIFHLIHLHSTSKFVHLRKFHPPSSHGALQSIRRVSQSSSYAFPTTRLLDLQQLDLLLLTP